MLSLTVKKLDAFKFDGVAESDNTEHQIVCMSCRLSTRSLSTNIYEE